MGSICSNRRPRAGAFITISAILGAFFLSAQPVHAANKVHAESHDAIATPAPPPSPPPVRTTSASASTAAPLPAPPPAREPVPAYDPNTSDLSSDSSHTDDPSIKVAALLGYSTDDLNLGLGLRAGTNRFFPHIYIGGTFVYQLGHSVSQTANGYTAEASLTAYYLGPEVGYDFYFAPIVLRVYAGAGIAGLTASSSVSGGPSVSDTTTKFVIWPGAQAIYELPESRFFIAGDLRFLTVPGGPAVGFFAMGGTKF